MEVARSKLWAPDGMLVHHRPLLPSIDDDDDDDDDDDYDDNDHDFNTGGSAHQSGFQEKPDGNFGSY